MSHLYHKTLPGFELNIWDIIEFGSSAQWPVCVAFMVPQIAGRWSECILLGFVNHENNLPHDFLLEVEIHLYLLKLSPIPWFHFQHWVSVISLWPIIGDTRHYTGAGKLETQLFPHIWMLKCIVQTWSNYKQLSLKLGITSCEINSPLKLKKCLTEFIIWNLMMGFHLSGMIMLACGTCGSTYSIVLSRWWLF